MPTQENQRRIPDGSVVLVGIIITLGIFAYVRTSERDQHAAEREQPAAASGGVGQAPVTSRPQSVKIEESPRENERTRERWPYVYRVIDSAAFMDAGNVSRIQTLLVNLYLESGADVRFEFVRGVSGDLASYAHERMQSRGIGREAGGRGMLVVYEMARQELRVEVGPGLARDLPDDFVGYVAREEVARFFASGDRMLGIKAMLFIIANRLRQATLAEQLPAQHSPRSGILPPPGSPRVRAQRSPLLSAKRESWSVSLQHPKQYGRGSRRNQPWLPFTLCTSSGYAMVTSSRTCRCSRRTPRARCAPFR